MGGGPEVCRPAGVTGLKWGGLKWGDGTEVCRLAGVTGLEEGLSGGAELWTVEAVGTCRGCWIVSLGQNYELPRQGYGVRLFGGVYIRERKTERRFYCFMFSFTYIIFRITAKTTCDTGPKLCITVCIITVCIIERSQR